MKATEPKIPNNPEVTIHIRYHLSPGQYVDLYIPSKMENFVIPKIHKTKIIKALKILALQKKYEAQLKEMSL